MQKIIYPFLILTLLFWTGGCGSRQPVQTEEFALGTIINQQVYGPNAAQAAQEASAMIKAMDALWTINSPGGDINKLNDQAGQGFVDLNPETINVLKEAQQISDLSKGKAFDITVAPLVKAWGVGTEAPSVLSAEVIQQLLPLVNYQDVLIDEASHSASLRRTGQMVDLGGIAKGYIGDMVIDIYRKNGITSAYANLGGNVMVLGCKPDGSAWKVGIQNPRGQNGEIIGVVSVTDKAVVTSGDYQRYFIKDGKRYCHIIDPCTGYPVDNGLMSVTIVASSSAIADGLAKAYVLGLDKGMELVESYGQAEAIFVTTDKKIYVTPGLRANFQLEDASNEYAYVQNG
jgi:Membrane-associated lipoprotein involved in thiamine biosynthesis